MVKGIKKRLLSQRPDGLHGRFVPDDENVSEFGGGVDKPLRRRNYRFYSREFSLLDNKVGTFGFHPFAKGNVSLVDGK